MNAKIVGNGDKTLVLAHGYGGSLSIWDYVLPRLSQSNRVLLFNWSFSSSVDPLISPFDPTKYSSLSAFADDLIALLDEMKMEGVVYVGHSMAGMIGCIASVKRPDLFSHLVLIGASPRYLNSDDYKGGFDRKEVENIFSVIISNFTTWARNFATLAMATSDPVPIEKFCKSFLGMRPETALSVAKAIFLSDWRDILEKIEVQCTIIQGTNDKVVPVSVANYMQSKMKVKARMEIIEGVGHFPQLTCPNMLINIIERVLMFTNGRNNICM
ncbi:strigolactone esterase D14-like [Asparagus officinalis]|uniref:strigolactone esterase D14-like n=1 Tax=Asparagus officinalis TaxID=4686 RepID=UPI00098E43DB|nr:strigolactone esterase D14-like [Asparagus officinalis]